MMSAGKPVNLHKTAEAAKLLAIACVTVRARVDDGKLSSIRTAGGQRRIDVDSYLATNQENKTRSNILDNFGDKKASPEEKKEVCRGAIYCRVSSQKQKDDLHRQI